MPAGNEKPGPQGLPPDSRGRSTARRCWPGPYHRPVVKPECGWLAGSEITGPQGLASDSRGRSTARRCWPGPYHRPVVKPECGWLAGNEESGPQGLAFDSRGRSTARRPPPRRRRRQHVPVPPLAPHSNPNCLRSSSVNAAGWRWISGAAKSSSTSGVAGQISRPLLDHRWIIR